MNVDQATEDFDKAFNEEDTFDGRTLREIEKDRVKAFLLATHICREIAENEGTLEDYAHWYKRNRKRFSKIFKEEIANVKKLSADKPRRRFPFSKTKASKN